MQRQIQECKDGLIHFLSIDLHAFVFEQLRTLRQRPDLLLAAEHAVATRAPAADDELLQDQLKRLERKVEGVAGERRRLADLYQRGLRELAEVQRRAKEVDTRHPASIHRAR